MSMKPPAITTPSSKSCDDREDGDKGKEGMANDDDEDELFPNNVDACC